MSQTFWLTESSPEFSVEKTSMDLHSHVLSCQKPKRQVIHRIRNFVGHLLVILLMAPQVIGAQLDGNLEQCLNLGRHEQARKIFRELSARELNPDKVRNLSHQASVNRFSYFHSLSAKRLTEIHQGNIESRLLEARTLLRIGYIEAAVETIRNIRDSKDEKTVTQFRTIVETELAGIHEIARKHPQYNVHGAIGNLRFLQGDYKLALTEYAQASKPNRSPEELGGCITWCQAMLNPDLPTQAIGYKRPTFFAMAALFASRGDDMEALRWVRKGIRAADARSWSRQIVNPFFPDDFPTVKRLLQLPDASAKAALAEYRTMMQMHQVVAALVKFYKDNKRLPPASKSDVSWRVQVEPGCRLTSDHEQNLTVFSTGKDTNKTPFVAFVGPDTAFPSEDDQREVQRYYDGTANTLMIVASHESVPIASTQDISIDQLDSWFERCDEGFFGATVSGELLWFPKQFPLEQLKILIGGNDKQRAYFPHDLILDRDLVDTRVYCDGNDCDDHAWVRMDVEYPSGKTPEETFKEIRTASVGRNWRKFYGCLTVDARYDQIQTLMLDITSNAAAARRAQTQREKDPELKVSMTKTAQRCRACLAVMEKHGLKPNGLNPSDVKNPDVFVADAWNALASPGASLFESNSYLTDLDISDEFAIATAHNYRIRHSKKSESCFVHFVKDNDRWLVDISPWWMPWGRPLIERRKILAERYAR